MNHLLTISLLFFTPLPSHAVEFSIQGKGGVAIWAAEESIKLPQDVGSASIFFLNKALDAKAISSFSGNEKGIASINELSNDVKVVSQNEFEYYGWCYSINGHESDALPSEVMLTDQNIKIKWFYAFAILRHDEWIAQCVPAEKSRAITKEVTSRARSRGLLSKNASKSFSSPNWHQSQ